MSKKKNEINVIEQHLYDKIYIIRGLKVMLDFDLAFLYHVDTKVLKRAVRRNISRFPNDFMFELNQEELDNLRRQFGTSSWGGTRYVPFAFTKQRIAILSSVLGSEQAIEINVQIMRLFVKIRKMAESYKELIERIETIEASQIENNIQIADIYKTIKELLIPEYTNREPVGYKLKKS